MGKNNIIGFNAPPILIFGYNQSYKLFGKVYIPGGYEFEELPKNIKMIMPDTSIVLKRMLQADSSPVDILILVDFLKPVYASNMYPLFMEFYKKLFAILRKFFGDVIQEYTKKIVIKRK